MTPQEPPKNHEAWVGREERRDDWIDPFRVQALDAVLDHQALPGAPLPPAWHWLCFLPLHLQAATGPDGHPARGGLLPLVDLPRRMWAGSRIQFHAAARAGEAVRRRSVIEAVRSKTGRSGALVFVTVQHEITQHGRLVVSESQDIVYRGEVAPDAVPRPNPEPAVTPPSVDWTRTLTPDEVLLFRYSALTFNAHRIHYDRAYATGAESYLDLVVHGPLQATLLLDLLRREMPQAAVRAFSFRGLSPAFCGRALHLGGRLEDGAVTLLAWDERGRTTMQAQAVVAA